MSVDQGLQHRCLWFLTTSSLCAFVVRELVQFDGLAGLFSCGYLGCADKVFNVLWFTSVIGLTGREAAHCTDLPNYCSLRRVQQIYGQWEESSIPTITPHARIKLTICNLNRLDTPASREKHNQPGRVPQEINSKAHCLFPLSLLLVSLTVSSSTYFLLSLTDWTLYTQAPLQSLHFTLFYTYGFVSHHWPSLLLSLQHSDILLGRDFHYLRSGTIYQGMGFSHQVWLTGGSSLYWISAIPFFTTPGSNWTDDKSEEMWSMSSC